MPTGKVVLAFDRRSLALILTVQAIVGTSFGMAVPFVQVPTDPAAVAHSRFLARRDSRLTAAIGSLRPPPGMTGERLTDPGLYMCGW
jgi:hypothetical protein